MAPSADLLWTLVRNNSCFIQKQKNAPVFTSEPGNLSGLNQFKFSGLTQGKTVNVSVAKKGKKELVTLATRKAGAKQALCKAAVVKTGIKKCAKKGKFQRTCLRYFF